MKRSKMLVIIKSCLYHLDSSDPEALSMSKSILNAIEANGMIPPNQYACTNEFRFEWEEEE